MENLTMGRRLASTLFSRDDVPAEARSLMDEFEGVVGAPGFPCYFAAEAFRRNELLFGLEDFRERGFDAIVSLFDAAVEKIRCDTDQTIILWVVNAAVAGLDEERAFLKKCLENLLIYDDSPWPSSCPVDPTSPRWDFWYKGVDFFINLSTPSHTLRRSRNLGRELTFVVQSRSSFDRLGEQGRLARKVIRGRVARYDDVPPSPALSSHGEGAELHQYFLEDSNDLSGRRPLLNYERVREILDSQGRLQERCDDGS